jgi:hypothetical protein
MSENREADPGPPLNWSAGAWTGARLLLLTTAAVAVVAGFQSTVFRTAEGHFSGALVVPIAVAAALVILALAPAPIRSAAAWFSLALIGQAVSLQLVRAGHMIGYQHYAMADLVTGGRAAALAFVVLQGLLVAWAMMGRWMSVARFVRDEIGLWRAVLLTGLFVITSATLSQDPRVYVAELVTASIVQAMALFTIVLAAMSLPASSPSLTARVDRLLGGRDTEESRRGGVDRFSIGLAVTVTIVCALLAYLSYERHPHVPDEVVYLYHARYFARGMLTMPLPPVPDAFNLDLMTFEPTRWYSPVPPGWPAVLAIGAFFGAAWLVNPILNGINVVLAYALLGEVYGRRTARLASLLLACSPWFLLMGMNFMTHTLTMTAALVAGLGVARLRRMEAVPWVWVLAAGAGIGTLALIRPLEGLVVAVLLGLWGLGGQTRDRLRRFAPVAVIAVVSMTVASISFPYNRALAGDALTFPLMAYTDSIYGVGTNALGFGSNRGLGWPGLDPFPGHGVVDVLVNGNLNAFQVNTELLGWAVGSALPILLLLALGPVRRTDAWMVIVIGAIVAVHSLYWFSGGPDFGARYWYLILVPCIALAARGIESLALRVDAAPSGDARVPAAALALCAAVLITFLPWRAIDKYFHYRNMRPDVRRLTEADGFGRSLVFVRGARHPDYASAAIYNPIDLSADVPIFVWDRGPEIARRVLEAFPGRTIHILDGPTRTGGGFRVVGRDVPPDELLATSAGPTQPRQR